MKKIIILMLAAIAAAAASSVAFGQMKMAKGTNNSVEAQIISLEKSGWQAWKDKNVAWYQANLPDDALSVHADGVTDKSQTIKELGNCEVKSFSLDNFKFLSLDNDAALITFTGMQDAVCGGKTIPASVRASSVYVKRGGKWLNVYYTEIPLSQ